MPRESVGDVLRKAWGWIRPGGLLVNMQPHGEPMELAVRLGDERRPRVGRAWDDGEAQEDMRSSRLTLAMLAERGLYVRRGETTNLLEYHLRSPEDWREFLARPKAGGVEIDPELVRTVFSHPEGSIITIEQTHITTWDRGRE